MFPLLTPDDHLRALVDAAGRLESEGRRAGPAAEVSTCPGWTVRDLVAHQGMVHRWAAAHLRREQVDRPEDFEAVGRTTDDLWGWFAEGLDELRRAIVETPEHAEGYVFLADAPPLRRFWARRQAHETTIHGVDALAARLGRVPRATEVDLDHDLALDGLDELLTGFLPRPSSTLRSTREFALRVRPTGVDRAWEVRVSADHPVTRRIGPSTLTPFDPSTLRPFDKLRTTRAHDNASSGQRQLRTTPAQDNADSGSVVAGSGDAEMRGTPAELYLGLWNRGDEIVVEGSAGSRPDGEDVVSLWRRVVRATW